MSQDSTSTLFPQKLTEEQMLVLGPFIRDIIIYARSSNPDMIGVLPILRGMLELGVDGPRADWLTERIMKFVSQ